MRIFLFLMIACLPALAQPALDKVLETWKADKSLSGAITSYCILDAESGKVIGEHDSHLFVIPASTLKVVTTSAALGTLGRGFRYETKIYFTGNFDKASGVLTGDIIIHGSGDPTLNSELYKNKKDSTEITDKWAEALKQKGLKELRGRIIGDASVYERHIPANWIWGDISNYFGVAPCGLSFNDNLYSIIFSSGATGSKAEIVDLKPKYNSITLDHDIEVTAAGSEDDAYVYGDPFGLTKNIKGTIPPNKSKQEVRAALPDPALLCAEFLERSLSKAGVKVTDKCSGSCYDADQECLKKEKTLMYTNYSPNLEKIVYFTNLTSNNLFCETLLKTMGKGSNYQGIDRVKDYWKERGIDVSELYMVDGNGLSRANTLTTSLEANLLQKIYKDSLLFKPFYNSLPISGVSGSMRTVGQNSFLEKNMHAKTGYISRARGYCGYVKTKAGKDLCFSVLFNNYICSAKEAKQKIELLLVALAEL